MRSLLLAAFASLAVAGCGDEAVNGPATGAACDKASIEAAVTQVGTTEKTKATLSKDGFTCEAGWAVAQADVGPSGAAVTETLIFKAGGQSWIPQDRAEVCAKPSPIPAAILKEACGSS